MKKNKKKTKQYMIISGISLLLLCAILLWSWLFSSLLKSRLTLEAGTYDLTEDDFLRSGLSNLNYRLLTDLSTIDTHVPGSYPVQFLVNGETRISTLKIQDTVPPKAKVRELAIPKGASCEGEDFIRSLEEETAVTIRILNLDEAPSELSCGTYPVTIQLTDAGGNTAKYPSTLTICNVKAARKAELGVKKFSAEKYRLGDGEELAWKEDIGPLLKAPGTYYPILFCDGIPVSVKLTVRDTTPPELTVPSLSLWAGQTAEAADFVKKWKDASQVVFSFEKEPDFNRIGKQEVTIIATDEAGNTAKARTALTIREDTEPPVITGAKDFSVPRGVTIAYRKNVFATDEKDGAVPLKVDSSQVNPGKEGTYPVTYSATDQNGNRSRISVAITITEPLSVTEKEVFALADEVLAELGVPDGGMTEYEILLAIFEWCRNQISYTGSSDKSSYVKAAYDGLTTRSGDCYTYSCTADLLMTRAGFESMEILRSGTGTFHSWNLVRYQEEWYHFDSCPLLSGETFVPFLVTDEELLAFSKDYAGRYPDESHRSYYQFNPDLYPERAKEAPAHE